jgi:hypothetical protein
VGAHVEGDRPDYKPDDELSFHIEREAKKLIDRRNKPFRIRRPSATELKDLRDGPVVLIGGFNNPWTLNGRVPDRLTVPRIGRGSC